MVVLFLLLSCLVLCLQAASGGAAFRRHVTLTHTASQDEICAITKESFAEEYSAIVDSMGIYDPQSGQSCSLSGDEDYFGWTESAHSRRDLRQAVDYEVCETLFNFSRKLLVGLNATMECCLTNSSNCQHNSTIDLDEVMDKAKAYGYGTLMVVMLSLLSLLGVFIVPLVKHHERCGKVYEYVNLFLISLGTSALFSDAVLHLLPRVFEQLLEEELERMRVEGGEGGGGEEGGIQERAIAMGLLWRACAVVGGVYFFYLFELFLHKILHHAHKDPEETSEETETNGPTELPDPSQRSRLIPRDSRVSFGHASISFEHSDVKYNTFHGKYRSIRKSLACKCGCKCDIQPLAVLIIVGDAFHNFTDGLALGAAISQNLALGVSTIIALVFHEIPHELGDYAILLSTGMSWYVALLFNFLSSLTALAGFFVGVSVGLLSQLANGWMLALAAGTFLYVSLVDLLPLIIHSELKGVLALFLTNLGFFLSFGILLVVAIYEEKFDSLIHTSL